MSDIVESVTVRLEEEHKRMLDKAQESYPVLSRGGLFLQLLYEYYWNREQGNGKGARLERIEATQEQTNARLAAIEATLNNVLREVVVKTK